ncbi:LON peptidase substrate-binding domain-containing protein [Vibrio fluvialis]|nr:LON peptidase substrate-binding domain-containing protein [Vibrio fluvialis]EKO3468116.1 LON peptidase substrate-binding domain-containing protein [Vibrio fluvialis]MBY7800549.1 LON peptidase substrate-binding domain-containing protein [Vibrio fluvialis]MBY8215168.1 LON peptidase substrate-binding domain-containing protein [Vibrio fluvialis]MBY8269466.1 LON peptidase substrate-binding domain-containing protein [Vibrio fluvialis]
MEEIMLFPLSSIVLPEGKMKLRIFEPRYKRMVAECSKANSGFGMCLFDSKIKPNANPLSEFGTWVKIVDFESLSDGLLGITVVGIKRFAIHKVRVEYDGLRRAKVEWQPSWPTESIGDAEMFLSHHLQNLYKEFPQVGDLYPHRFFDDASWVAQRWLELLPLSNQQFDALSQHEDCHRALAFLTQTIETYND